MACAFVRSAYNPTPLTFPWVTPGLDCSAWGGGGERSDANDYVAFYSTNGGDTWEKPSLPQGLRPNDIGDWGIPGTNGGLSCQANGPRAVCHIHLATKGGLRNLVSTDGGKTWAFA